MEGATCALCVRLYVKRYTFAPVEIILYAQHHALKSTTQKKHYHKVNRSDARGKGTHKNQLKLIPNDLKYKKMSRNVVFFEKIFSQLFFVSHIILKIIEHIHEIGLALTLK